MRQIDMRWFIGIHIGLVFAIPFIVLAIMSGCTDEIKEREGELGSVANTEQVENAILDGIFGASVVNAEPGQSSIYEYNIRIETGPIIKIGDRLREMVDIFDENNIRHYVLENRNVIYNADGSIDTDNTTEVVLQQELAVANFRAQSVKAFKEMSPLTRLEGFFRLAPREDDEELIYPVYYNFEKSSYYEAPPQAVASRPDCGGLEPCQMAILDLKFDEVYAKDGEVLAKYNHHWKFTRNVPHLFDVSEPQDEDLSFYYCPTVCPIVSACIGSLQFISDDDRRYYVKQCLVLRDFQY